jgi:hypothetical protein
MAMNTMNRKMAIRDEIRYLKKTPPIEYLKLGRIMKSENRNKK